MVTFRVLSLCWATCPVLLIPCSIIFTFALMPKFIGLIYAPIHMLQNKQTALFFVLFAAFGRFLGLIEYFRDVICMVD
jgi:hypothetical protein